MELKIGNYRIQIAKEYKIDGTMPNIYNAEGRPLETYFIRNRHSRHAPYGHEGKYFFWDRYNYGLDTHFYGHEAMLTTLGKPLVKYGMLTESRTIVPKDYELFRRRKGLAEEFCYVFTYDDRILNEVENARFYPICASVWYGRESQYAWDAEAHLKKSRNISIVSSAKTVCRLHDVRIAVSRYCKENNLADTFGTFDGGRPCLIDDSLRDYRYSIIIENDISDYFFTEKITNCFAAQVIPVYLGARKIDQYFNPEGIITVTEKQLGNIEEVLRLCTREAYEEKRAAILDNYSRVREYVNMQDYLYEHYLGSGRHVS